MFPFSQTFFRTSRGMLLALAFASGAAQAGVLGTDVLKSCIDEFRADDRWYFNVATDADVSTVNNGVYGGQAVKNADAFDYLKDRIPLLDIPDADLEKTYYYRWWTFRKHIKNLGTAAAPNRIVTEFIDPVDWADSGTNAIAAPAGHHLYEGRWLDDPDVMREYIRYWMVNSAANPRRYSAWLADGVLARQKVTPDDALMTEMVASTTNRLNLANNWLGWQSGGFPGGAQQIAYLAPEDGLFWQYDDRDAMEYSFGGSGRRPSINSYLYGDARAIAEMFRIAARTQPENATGFLASAAQFDTRADTLRTNFQNRLWDPQDEFFKTGYGPNGSRPPNASMDWGIRRHTWWSADRLGNQEWIQYDFTSTVTVDRTEIYFFEDQASGGGCRMPASWVLQYWDGSQWVNCITREGDSFTTQINAFNVVRINPVQTTKLRVLAQTQANQSAGTLEWRAFSPTGENVAFNGVPSASYTDTYGGTLLALNDEKPTGYNQQDKREEIGFTPWYFELPQDGGAIDFDKAWSHLSKFDTPYGLASAGTDENGFFNGGLGICCAWDGPIWPFATSITLTAMSHLLHDYQQSYLSRNDYLSRLTTYALSQRFTLNRNGETRTMCWIDETLAAGGGTAGLWSHIGGNGLSPGTAPRGYAYNHSTFADLVITGLIGLNPRTDDTVEVDPLLPVNPVTGDYSWTYFCLDRIPYHGRHLTIVYDKDGSRYQLGAGLSIYADGMKIASAPKAGKLTATLPGLISVWAKDFFPAETPAANLAASADPDGDGYSNAVEYLFGTDPSSSAAKPQITTSLVTENGVASLVLKVVLRDDATAVTYQPEYSTDLVNWAAGGFTESQPESQGNGTSLHTFRSLATTPPATAGFLRLAVQEK